MRNNEKHMRFAVPSPTTRPGTSIYSVKIALQKDLNWTASWIGLLP